MKTLNVLIVHGIGWGGRDTGYARPLQDGIRRGFDQAIRQLRLRDVDGRAARSRHALRFEAALWDAVTQKPQDALLRVMFGRTGLFGRLKLTITFRRNLVALLGDVIAYECDPNNAVYQAIHREVDRAVGRLSEASAPERGAGDPAPLTIVGHSLGSVIASDYVWDHTRRGAQPHILPEADLSLANFVAMGSPMALYSLRNNAYGQRSSITEALDSPITVEPDGGLWLNLFDPQDPIAFPLEPIESYRAAGVIDRAVGAGNWLTGWNLLSHTGYWRCEEAGRLVGRKLALDWARANSPRFAERDYERALAAYRKELRRKP